MCVAECPRCQDHGTIRNQRDRSPSLLRDDTHRRHRSSVQWAEPLQLPPTRPTLAIVVREVSAGRRSPLSEQTPQKWTRGPNEFPDDGSRASPASSSDGEEGYGQGVSDALRLMEEVRDLAPDLREAILRRAFAKPARQSRSRTRKD